MKKFHQANLDETFICSKVGFSGRLLQVNIDSVILPNGRETTRELIHHPGAVAIVPILDDGSIIFVKQYRYPVGTVMYEIPAGKLDPGEEPDVCAERELSEETGYSAKEWQRLTSIVTTPGFTDEDEFIDVVKLTSQQVREMVLEGDIFDSKTLSALCVLEMLK